MLITRRGSMLARLRPADLIETGLWEDDAGTALASSELVVHRAIYRETTALAVVHAHPPCAITLSLSREEILPLDAEGSYLLRRVPVVTAVQAIGSAEVGRLVAPLLKDYRVVMLRGHGCFAAGRSLEEAYQWVSALEASSRVVYLAGATDRGVKEFG